MTRRLKQGSSLPYLLMWCWLHLFLALQCLIQLVNLAIKPIQNMAVNIQSNLRIFDVLKLFHQNFLFHFKVAFVVLPRERRQISFERIYMFCDIKISLILTFSLKAPFNSFEQLIIYLIVYCIFFLIFLHPTSIHHSFQILEREVGSPQ